MRLIRPALTFETSYKQYIKELGSEERYPFPMDFDHADFKAMLERIEDFRLGRNIPNGYVPSSTYWLIEGDELIGVSNLRHYLNDGLREAGGHIGLGVRPGYRHAGVGVKLLNLTLDKARSKGIDEAHIHCYADNRASTAMIEKCGGRFHSSLELEGHVIQRYIISL